MGDNIPSKVPANVWDNLMGFFGENSSQDPALSQVASFQPPAVPPAPTPTLINKPGNAPVDPFMVPGKTIFQPGGGAKFANFDKLMGGVADQGVSSINDQRAHLAKLQDQVNQMPTQQQKPDLGGLMALADAWGGNGSHMAADYQRPMTSQQLQTLQAAAQEKVSSLQNNLSKDDLSLLKDQLGSELQKQLINAHWGTINQGKATQQDDHVVNTLQQSMLKDKVYAGAQSMQSTAPEIQKLIDMARVNPAAKNELAIKMALYFNGGQRLNMPEISAQGGSNAMVDKINQMITSAGKGTLSPENADYMSDLINETAEGGKRMADGRALDFANKVRARTSYDGPTSYEKLTGTVYQPPTAKRSAPNLSPLDPSSMTREEKIQYLMGNH